jgi:hypothetical protein
MIQVLSAKVHSCKLEKEGLMALGVKTLADMYGSSAEKIGSGELAGNRDILTEEAKRYQKGRQEILDLAVKIMDEAHRAAALSLRSTTV